MNPTTNVNPLANLAAAEQALISAINAAAGQLDQLGTNNVNAALEKLQSSATAAQARLASTVVNLTAIVGNVVEAFTLATAGIVGQLALNVEQPQVAAQIAATIPTSPADATPDQVPQAAQEARQAVAAIETTQEPATVAIEAHEVTSAAAEPHTVVTAACSQVPAIASTAAQAKDGRTPAPTVKPSERSKPTAPRPAAKPRHRNQPRRQSAIPDGISPGT